MMIFVPSRRSTFPWVSLVVCGICLTAFATWLVIQVSQGDLDRGDKLASIVSMSVAVVTLPLSVFAVVIAIRQGQPASAALTPLARLDAMAEALAISVRAQWEAEEQIRRVNDPFPLPARWTNAADHLMDHWPKIHGAPHRREPIDLDGHGEHIVDTLNRIPSGRLVVLGRAGAGKTSLASRFALTLLANRNRGAAAPVPVIFSLGSWDPSAHSLRDWQADQLTTTYPILAERDGTGTTLAAQLLATARVLSVLDGFDEISEGLRVDAINALNAGLRPTDRVVLTSRPEEYAAAVRAGDVLTAAAVVRLEGLTVADIADYLPVTTRKADVHGGHTKWDPVLDHMRQQPAGSALIDVLSLPLMVALARTIFSDTDADPAELLGVTSAIELEERLLADFVPAVYRDSSRGVDDATRRLRFLAVHLRRLDTYDLAWWQLVQAIPRVLVGLVSGFVIALMVWLGVGMLGLLGTWTSTDARTAWLVGGVLAAFPCGAAGGIVVGTGRGLLPLPARIRLRIAGQLSRVRADLANGLRGWRVRIWIVVWSAAGAVFGLTASVFLGSGSAIVVGLAVGLGAGLAIWLAAAVARALGAPVDPTETVSPAELLRTDRATALGQGFIVGTSGSTAIWVAIWLGFEPVFGQPFLSVFAHGVWLLGWLVAAGAGVLIWMLFVTVWGPWLIARSWLPLTGRLPWSVMGFLADAHRRGVLRQAGGVYQFRHARLRDHLAAR